MKYAITNEKSGEIVNLILWDGEQPYETEENSVPVLVENSSLLNPGDYIQDIGKIEIAKEEYEQLRSDLIYLDNDR